MVIIGLKVSEYSRLGLIKSKNRAKILSYNFIFDRLLLEEIRVLKLLEEI